MPKKSKKSANFQVNSQDGVILRDFVENLNKLLGSWFKNEDVLTPVSNSVAEKIGNLIPRETKPRKRNKKLSRFYIDLSKLEQNSKITKEEKKKLKRLIQELKCENPRESKCINESRKKKTVVRKVNFEKKRKRTHIKQNEKKENANNLLKAKLKASRECQICLGIVEERANTFRRKKRKQSSTITVSKENILQAIIELDPRARGDTISCSELCRRVEPGKLNQVLREGQNINIKNIELKYVNPTYVVQYSTNTPEEEPEAEPRVGRQRFYSSAALEAHLGQRPALNVGGERADNRDVTMHYDPSSSYVIGVGQETERMKVERERELSLRQSLVQKKRESVRPREKEVESIVGSIEVPERELVAIEFEKEVCRTCSLKKPKEQYIVLEEPTPEKKEAFVDRKWPKDTRDPLEVLSQYEDVTQELPRVTPRREQRCKRMREFVRKWLCLTTEESETNMASGRATGTKTMNKKTARKEKLGQGEIATVRITEEEFNGNYFKPGRVKRVTFEDQPF